MAATIALWTHALAALMFALLAAVQRTAASTGPRTGLPRLSFTVALGFTALWALAVAGLPPGDVGARVAEGLRNLAWLGFMFALVRRARGARGAAVAGLYGIVALVVVAATVIAVLGGGPDARASALVDSTRIALRMTAAIGALVLVNQLFGVAQGAPRLALAGIAAIWGCDLALYAGLYLGQISMAAAAAIRGVATVAIAPVLAVAALSRGDWTLRLSRTATLRSLFALSVALYVVLVALASEAIGAVAGDRARPYQAALVIGAATTLLTFCSTPWLRAWVRVKLSKHLFRHRYDYRAEWLRFTDTLGRPGEDATPLGTRIVKAMADLTCSPAGVLLVPDGPALGVGAAWNWDADALPAGSGDEMLARLLTAAPRIVELDAVRAALATGDGAATGTEAAAIPQWMLDRADAWAVVPLPHFDTLGGAILLARPPLDRRLDWEDFDLLRLAGRQVASYLAEERSHAALADATRFDEFNRRFAFIMHDIKNLVSQLTLVARNAERHADNPAFRADMVATLQDSATRMNELLARLSQHHTRPGDALQPVEIAALVERVARARRALHPIATTTVPTPPALADPARVEQLIGHLLQNAIEASPAGEPITLSVSPVDGRVAIDVGDRGCGMSPSFIRDQLFRPFVSSKPGGFGIGAFEARQLAQAMGGSVEVHSREGEGTRFRVLLPVAGAAMLERAA